MSDEKQLLKEKVTFNINAMDLWKLLQDVIKSEELVRVYREYLELYLKIKHTNKTERHYFSGSRGEGFQFSFSDIDILHSLIMNYVATDTMHKECNIIAIQKECQPGHCVLFFIRRSGSTILGIDYIERSTFLEERKSVSKNGRSDEHIHGPCNSLNYPNAYDRCSAFPIHPDFSNKFLQSFSTKFWNNVKSKVINESIPVMHCVAKGPEMGEDYGTQWLISFSVLEQYIVHSLNHVQFFCYGLMKILLHSNIDSCAETHDTLSSYHVKTTLFHVLEDIHPDFWIPQNIFYCFRICITRLLLFVMKGYCPNYFRPECNLLLKLNIKEKRGEIVKKLRRLLKFEILDLCFCTSLYSNKRLFISQQLRANMTDDGCEKSIVCVLDVLNELSDMPSIFFSFSGLISALMIMTGYENEYYECMDCILRIFNLLQLEKDDSKTVFLKHVFLLLMRRVGVILYDNFLMSGRKDYLLSAEVAFMLVQKVGASGAVYLATLWFCLGKYTRSMNLLLAVVIKISYCTKNANSEFSKSDCDFMRCLSLAYPQRIILYRSSNFFPKDLKENVQNGIVDFMIFDPSYVCFLLFLCYFELNEMNNCMVCIQWIQRSFNENCFEILNESTRHNSKRLHEIATKKMPFLENNLPKRLLNFPCTT